MPQSHRFGQDASNQTMLKARSTLPFCRRNEHLSIHPSSLAPCSHRWELGAFTPSSNQNSLNWAAFPEWVPHHLMMIKYSLVFRLCNYVFKTETWAGFKSKWGHLSIGVCELGGANLPLQLIEFCSIQAAELKELLSSPQRGQRDTIHFPNYQ